MNIGNSLKRYKWNQAFSKNWEAGVGCDDPVLSLQPSGYTLSVNVLMQGSTNEIHQTIPTMMYNHKYVVCMKLKGVSSTIGRTQVNFYCVNSKGTKLGQTTLTSSLTSEFVEYSSAFSCSSSYPNIDTAYIQINNNNSAIGQVMISDAYLVDVTSIFGDISGSITQLPSLLKNSNEYKCALAGGRLYAKEASWNQHIINSPDDLEYWRAKTYCTVSSNNNVLSVKLTSSNRSDIRIYQRYRMLEMGHKYAFITKVNCPGDIKAGIVVEDGSGNAVYSTLSPQSIQTLQDEWITYSELINWATDNVTYKQFSIQLDNTNYSGGSSAAGYGTINLTDIILTDLTSIYGAGNEPNLVTFMNSKEYLNATSTDICYQDTNSIMIPDSGSSWNQFNKFSHMPSYVEKNGFVHATFSTVQQIGSDLSQYPRCKVEDEVLTISWPTSESIEINGVGIYFDPSFLDTVSSPFASFSIMIECNTQYTVGNDSATVYQPNQWYRISQIYDYPMSLFDEMIINKLESGSTIVVDSDFKIHIKDIIVIDYYQLFGKEMTIEEIEQSPEYQYALTTRKALDYNPSNVMIYR